MGHFVVLYSGSFQNGAMTFSLKTFSIMDLFVTLRINDIFSVIMLSAIMLSVIIKLSIIMLNVVMLIVVAPPELGYENITHTQAAKQSVTKFVAVIVMSLVTPTAAAGLEF
jgi:hypothetical protein